MEDRPERGLREEREVGVPETPEGELLALLGFAHHGDHLGVTGHRLDEWHRAERPEPAAERHLLFGGEVLGAEEHHLVIEDGPADLGDDGIREIAGKIDPADHGAARARDRGHGHRPVRLPRRDSRDGDEGLGRNAHAGEHREDA